MRVSDLLLEGKDNATKGAELVKAMELSDLRDLTQLIERERKDGFPICASTDMNSPGYYLAGNPEELEAYINSLDRRIRNMTVTRIHCESTLLKMTGQEKMGGC